MAFVNFHQELTEGEKRGLSRSVRFVYMELSLKARPLRGTIPLPRGMSDLDALWDILGGSKSEIRTAISVLTEGDDPMIRFETVGQVVPTGGHLVRHLVVVAWEAWNKSDKSSARVIKFRAEKAVRKGNEINENSQSETRFIPERNADETEVKRQRNGSETPLEEKREEEKRREKTPLPPSGVSVADQCSEVFEHFLTVRKKHRPKSRTVGLEPKDRKDLAAKLKAGLTVADMMLACEGLFLSPHHLGDNTRDTAYLDFKYVIKNAEAFIALAEDAAERLSPKSPLVTGATPQDAFVPPPEGFEAGLESIFAARTPVTLARALESDAGRGADLFLTARTK